MRPLAPPMMPTLGATFENFMPRAAGCVCVWGPVCVTCVCLHRLLVPCMPPCTAMDNIRFVDELPSGRRRRHASRKPVPAEELPAVEETPQPKPKPKAKRKRKQTQYETPMVVLSSAHVQQTAETRTVTPYSFTDVFFRAVGQREKAHLRRLSALHRQFLRYILHAQSAPHDKHDEEKRSSADGVVRMDFQSTVSAAMVVTPRARIPTGVFSSDDAIALACMEVELMASMTAEQDERGHYEVWVAQSVIWPQAYGYAFTYWWWETFSSSCFAAVYFVSEAMRGSHTTDAACMRCVYGPDVCAGTDAELASFLQKGKKVLGLMHYVTHRMRSHCAVMPYKETRTSVDSIDALYTAVRLVCVWVCACVHIRAAYATRKSLVPPSVQPYIHDKQQDSGADESDEDDDTDDEDLATHLERLQNEQLSPITESYSHRECAIAAQLTMMADTLLSRLADYGPIKLEWYPHLVDFGILPNPYTDLTRQERANYTTLYEKASGWRIEKGWTYRIPSERALWAGYLYQSKGEDASASAAFAAAQRLHGTTVPGNCRHDQADLEAAIATRRAAPVGSNPDERVLVHGLRIADEDPTFQPLNLNVVGRR